MGVYRFTHMHSEFTCVLVYAFTYMHAKYTCVWVYGSVLYVCVGMYIYTSTHERHLGCIQIHCVRTGIHECIYVVRVGVGIHMYTYIYEHPPCVHANLHMCVYILVCVHADFTCGCVDV